LEYRNAKKGLLRARHIYFNKNPNWDKKYNQRFHNKFNCNKATIHDLRCEGPGEEKYTNQTSSELIETFNSKFHD